MRRGEPRRWGGTSSPGTAAWPARRVMRKVTSWTPVGPWAEARFVTRLEAGRWWRLRMRQTVVLLLVGRVARSGRGCFGRSTGVGNAVCTFARCLDVRRGGIVDGLLDD